MRESQPKARYSNCSIDECWPPGTGFQAQVRSPPAAVAKARVVGTAGKTWKQPGEMSDKEKTAREALMTCRKRRNDVKTAEAHCRGISFGEACLRTEAASGIQVA